MCGLFWIASATCLLLGVPEQLVGPTAAQPVSSGDDGRGNISTSIEGVEELADKYTRLVDICSLPSVHQLVFFLATIEVSESVEVAERLTLNNDDDDNYYRAYTRGDRRGDCRGDRDDRSDRLRRRSPRVYALLR